MEQLIRDMNFRGIDNTYGAGGLEKIAEKAYNGMTNIKEKFAEFTLCEEFKRDMKTSWLLNLLCQYTDRSSYKLGDILWYRHIKQMVLDGALYMSLGTIDNWAYADKEFDMNCKNLEPLGITISNERGGNSDGGWTIDKPIELFKVYPTDEETPNSEDIERLIISDAYGVVEFGTQKICKSAMTLMCNDILLRVSYKNKIMPTPVCAFFVNIKQIDTKQLIINN